MMSLPHLLETLEGFGEVAGFKVNYSKSEAYPINLSREICSSFHSRFKFKLVKKQWTHLGIIIPFDLKDLYKRFDLKDLYKVNFDPLVTRIREKLRDWSQMTLSWPERLELIKIILLPQFIFLFQNLPVQIPNASFTTWQKELVNFVWKRGPHRINKQFLSRPKKLGGYGLPLLENYYLAAQLRIIYTYLASPELLNWMQIEEFSVGPKRIREIIWCNRASHLVSAELNPFLHLTLRLWDRCRAKLVHQPSIATAFVGQS